MFFSKSAAFALVALATFVAAAPSSEYYGNCNTGEIHCCNDVHDVHSEGAKDELSLLGISIENVTGSIGSQCSPLTVGGIGAGNKCKSNAFCCENNQFTGVVVIGCSPIYIDL